MKKDFVLAPIGEAALLVIAGAAGWFSHQPMLFASLGPTAYELIETPHRRSAKPYSILVGHAAAVATGFMAIYGTGAVHVAPVSSAGVPAPRIWAAAVAALVTVLITLLLRASQPAALSTTLLVSLGILQKPIDAAVILIAVVLMVLFGEPVRAYRLRHDPEKQKKAPSE
ncbi:MAG: HPP family protein [Acidobacteriota bacterium]